MYKVAWPTYFAGKLLIKLKHIGLVNILAGDGVVEELIQAEAEPGPVGAALKKLVQSPEQREALRVRLLETADKLGGPGAHDRAAAAVAEWLDAGMQGQDSRG